MQCHSYLPVYQSHYDLNVDANGGSRPMYNSNGTFQNGHCTNYMPPSPVSIPKVQLGYKELLRQTMLLHEVTFRSQVQELHRLYKRQKAMMGEIKSKALHVNHLQLEMQSSNSSTPKVSTITGLNTQHSISFLNFQYAPCTTDTAKIQRALDCIKEESASHSPVASQSGGNLNHLQTSESKGTRIGGKLLDLELPAEVYINSDERESLGIAEFSQGPTSVCIFSNEHSKFVFADVEIIRANTPSLAISQEPFLLRGTKSSLTDLNVPPTTSQSESDRIPGNEGTPEISERISEPLYGRNVRSQRALDEGTMDFSVQPDDTKSLVHTGSSVNRPSHDLSKNSLVVQALPSINNQLRSCRAAKHYSMSTGLNKENYDASSRCGPSSDMPKFLQGSSDSKLKASVASLCCISSITSKKLEHVNGVNYIDLNSAVIVNGQPTTSGSNSSGEAYAELVGAANYNGGTTRKNKRCRLIDINLPCDFSTDKETLPEDDIARHHNMTSGKFNSSGKFNLNMCLIGDGLPPKSFPVDRNASVIDLDAPLSPEVEERPPPRGDSEENLAEVALQVLTQDLSEPLAELAKIAAETIVSMSSSKSISFPDSKGMQNCEASDSRCLDWFAELVYTLSPELDDDNGALRGKDVDDFEAMTLELTELKAEEYCCTDCTEISSMTCSISLSGQSRKGRMKRSKRKDFQREVLPSLASLSRYEVTEDMQIIEGLMVAAGTHWHLRTRRACRLGRRSRVIKPQTSTTDLEELNDGFFMSWGKGNRRPRGQRSPASPLAVLSRWLELAN